MKSIKGGVQVSYNNPNQGTIDFHKGTAYAATQIPNGLSTMARIYGQALVLEGVNNHEEVLATIIQETIPQQHRPSDPLQLPAAELAYRATLLTTALSLQPNPAPYNGQPDNITQLHELFWTEVSLPDHPLSKNIHQLAKDEKLKDYAFAIIQKLANTQPDLVRILLQMIVDGQDLEKRKQLPLAQLFWQQRGWYAPNLKSGTLKEVDNLLIQLNNLLPSDNAKPSKIGMYGSQLSDLGLRRRVKAKPSSDTDQIFKL